MREGIFFWPYVGTVGIAAMTGFVCSLIRQRSWPSVTKLGCMAYPDLAMCFLCGGSAICAEIVPSYPFWKELWLLANTCCFGFELKSIQKFELKVLFYKYVSSY